MVPTPFLCFFLCFWAFFAPLGPLPPSEGAISWTGDKVFELFKNLKWFLWTSYEGHMMRGSFLGKFGDILGHFGAILGNFDW